MIGLESYMEKLQRLVTGEITEDEAIALLEELKADKEKSIALKSQKVADFFNRDDVDNSETETETESEESEETSEDDSSKNISIDDLFMGSNESEEKE